MRIKSGLVAVVTAAATALLTSATVSAAGAATPSTGSTATRATVACSAKADPSRASHLRGVTRAVSQTTGCATSKSTATALPTHVTSDPSVGTPPLIFHGGPVMGT